MHYVKKGEVERALDVINKESIQLGPDPDTVVEASAPTGGPPPPPPPPPPPL